MARQCGGTKTLSIDIIEINGCKRNLVAELPPEELEGEIDRLAHKYARDVKVPGFRPGRVPLSVVKTRFRSELRHDATHELIERTWKACLDERGIRPLAEPHVEKLEADVGSPLRFTLSFEVLPQFQLQEYKGIAVAQPESHVGDEDVHKALDRLRDEHAQYVPVEDGEIKDGHLVTMSIDGDFNDGGKPLHDDEASCVVGDSRTNEKFSENLRGARAGETRSFEVTYPDDYHRPRYAGKTVRYSLTIKDVKEKSLPEASDDFAKDLGAASLDDLESRLREELVTKTRETAEKNGREAVLTEVLRSHSFEVPESMVKEELEEHAHRLALTLARQGVDINKASIDWKKIFDEERPHAEDAVRRTILLDAVVQRENLDVSDDELDAEIEKLAQGGSKSGAALRGQLEKDGRIETFRAQMRRYKALDFIYRNATISRG
jgi:trigger factor